MAVRVAFATDDFSHVGDHFAKAEGFLVYEIRADGYRLQDRFRHGERSPEAGESSRILNLVAQLGEPDLIYAGHIGPQAAATLTRRRIHPLLAPAATPIEELCQKLQAVLQGNPPPWLRRLENETREEG